MENDYQYEIDIMQIFKAIKKVFIPCAIICMITTISAYFITKTMLTPVYSATGKIIVVQKADTQNPTLSYNDVQLSQKLVNTYREILKSERISDLVLIELGLNYGSGAYNSMVTVSAANNTEVINVKVDSIYPNEASLMANTIISTFQKEIYSIMSVENVSVLNWAKTPKQPSSPNLINNLIVGLLVGIALSGCVVTYVLLKDNNIKTEEQFRTVLEYPIIGIIPDFKSDSNRTEK